jgi:serine/threonine-protein kinase
VSTQEHDRWKLVSPHLDIALGLSEVERASWLARLREEHPTVAAEVESLIDQQRKADEEQFLEHGSALFPGEPCHAGQRVGYYTLIAEIGVGGMGSVWLAERSDGRFDRQVAIKFLNIALSGLSAEHRFKREGSILARLSHPNIAELIDAGVSPGGQSYLVLEYIEGKHIDRYCDEHRLDISERIHLFLGVLAAGSYAHRNLIVHRDIKPSNVLVRDDGQVKLLDFGIAKLLSDESSDETTLLTLEGVRPMTPAHAAPEQLQGGCITTATDVYALGVLLYELLTGLHPAGNNLHSPAELVRAVLDQDPLRPSVAVAPLGAGMEVAGRARLRATTPDKLRRTLRGDLDTIILKALKKEPSERYHSVAALAEDLEHWTLNEPIRARPDSIRYRAIKFARRHVVSVSLAGLSFAAIVTGTTSTLIQARTAQQQRDFALRQLVRAERTTGLNELLISEVAPSGRPLTGHELLEREEQIVEREQYDDLASHVELLISVGEQYSGADENDRSRRLLGEAYQLSHRVPDPSTRAKAACELGWVLIPTGEFSHAEQLFQSGLHELPAGAQFDPVRVLCLVDGAEIAYRNGDAKEALVRTQTAERAFNRSFVRSPVEELNVLVGLADAYAGTGRFQEADAAFQRASSRMTSLGYDNTQKAVKLFNDWGLMLSDAGRPLDSAEAYRRAIEITRTNETEGEVLPALLHNYSAVLRELGKLNEAADYSKRAHEKAVRANNEIVALQSNMQMARIYRDQHDYAHAQVLMTELDSKLRQSLPPGHYAFAVFTSDKSLLAEAQGDMTTALQLAKEAVAMDEGTVTAGGQGAVYLPALLTRRSRIELETGRPDKAEADADRAVRLLKDKMEAGSCSSSLGRAYLALANALAAEGRREESRTMSRAAYENLQATLGSAHPETISANKLLNG